MKVLLTLESSERVKAGVEVFTDHLKRALPDLEIIDYEKAARYVGPSANFAPLKEPLKSLAIAKYLKKSGIQPEIIFANNLHAWPLKKNKTPIVTIFHGTFASFAEEAMQKPSLNYLRTRFIYSFFERTSGKNANVCIANSAFTAQLMKKDYGLDARVIYNAIDTEMFKSLSKAKARLKLGWGNEKVVLFVGRPDYTKGFDVVEDVARMMPDIKFVSILFPRNESKLQNHKTLEALKHSELPMYYSAADVLLYPSRFEGFGFVPLEALACNLPVVASNTGVLTELDINGLTKINGFHPMVYAEAIRNILETEKPINSHNEIAENFSLLKFSRNYKQLVETITRK